MIDASSSVRLRDGLLGFATGFSFPWHRRNRRLDTREEVDHVPLSLRGWFSQELQRRSPLQYLPRIPAPRCKLGAAFVYEGIVDSTIP